jgi:hypothetical protein
MGWSESPPFFFAATETACGIIDDKVRNSTCLPDGHQLEQHEQAPHNTINGIQQMRFPPPNRGLHQQFHWSHSKHQ